MKQNNKTRQKKRGMPVSEMQEPVWDAQKGESADAYTKFITFRDLPNKQTKNVLTKLGLKSDQKSIYNINKLASDWHWNERAIKYQEHLARKEEEAKIEEIKEMNRRHRTISKGALTIIAKIEKKFLTQFDAGQLDEDMTLKDWGDLMSKLSGRIDSLAKVERAALGQPTEIIQSDIDAKVEYENDYDNMSHEELNELARKLGFKYEGPKRSDEGS